MPPRFRDESIIVMNRALLQRVPECIYTPDDIAELQQSEGLDAAQIIIYAKNFRARTQNEDRALALTLGHENGPKESVTIKTKRFFVTMFNVGIDFATEFKVTKNGSSEPFVIKHMEFAWDRNSCSVKMFLVFETAVSAKRLTEVCKNGGGGCIFIQTFNIDPTHELASGALQSVLECGTKEGNEKFSKGICDPVLDAIVKSKMINAKSMDTAAFDEKTAAVIKYSLEGIGHQMDICNDGVAGIDTKIEKMHQIMTENSSLLSTANEDMLHLRVIAQQKTTKVHAVAAEKGHITRIVNKRNATIAELEDQIDEFKAAKVLHDERMCHLKEKNGYLKEIVTNLKEKNAKLRNASDNDATIAGKDAIIDAIKTTMEAKDAIIASKDATIAAKDDIIAKGEAALADKKNKLAAFEAELKKKTARFEALLAAKDATITEMRRTNLDAKIAAVDGVGASRANRSAFNNNNNAEDEEDEESSA